MGKREKKSTRNHTVWRWYNETRKEPEPLFYLYLSSGLLINFILFTAIWVAVVGFYLILFSYGILDGLLRYTHSFVELSFIVGFVFNFFLMQSFKGYMNQPVYFRRLLNHITSLARKLFVFLNCTRKYSSKETFTVNQWRSTSSEKEIRFFHPLFTNLISSGCDLFLHNSSNRDSLHDLSNELIYYDSKCNCVDKQMIDLISDITIQFTRLLNEGFIKECQYKILLEGVDKIESILTEIDISHNINNPNLFNIHLKLILGAWFVIWLPFTLTLRLEYAAVVVYPIVMNLLFGVNIIRKYMKSALDPNRPIRLNNFEKWNEDCKKEITRLSCINNDDFEMCQNHY